MKAKEIGAEALGVEEENIVLPKIPKKATESKKSYKSLVEDEA